MLVTAAALDLLVLGQAALELVGHRGRGDEVAHRRLHFLFALDLYLGFLDERGLDELLFHGRLGRCDFLDLDFALDLAKDLDLAVDLDLAIDLALACGEVIGASAAAAGRDQPAGGPLWPDVSPTAMAASRVILSSMETL